MIRRLAQYKGGANEASWRIIFEKYDVIAKTKEFQRSRLFKVLCSELSSSDKVLEGGCGMGKLSLALIDKGYDVYGLDYCRELVDKIHSAKPEFKERFWFMDARNLLLPAEEYDVYISPGVIEHFHDGEQHEILSEARRALKSGGKLLCIVPYMNKVKQWKADKLIAYNESQREKGVDFYQYVYSEEELRELLAKEGFEVERVHFVGLHDTRLFGVRVIPRFMHGNKWLLSLFGTTICAVAKKV